MQYKHIYKNLWYDLNSFSFIYIFDFTFNKYFYDNSGIIVDYKWQGTNEMTNEMDCLLWPWRNLEFRLNKFIWSTTPIRLFPWGRHPCSSSPPSQSCRPSHRAALVIHFPLEHRKAIPLGPGHPSEGLHASSEPSGQSLCPSHTKNQEIHCPLERH